MERWGWKNQTKLKVLFLSEFLRDHLGVRILHKNTKYWLNSRRRSRKRQFIWLSLSSFTVTPDRTTSLTSTQTWDRYLRQNGSITLSSFLCKLDRFFFFQTYSLAYFSDFSLSPWKSRYSLNEFNSRTLMWIKLLIPLFFVFKLETYKRKRFFKFPEFLNFC